MKVDHLFFFIAQRLGHVVVELTLHGERSNDQQHGNCKLKYHQAIAE